MYQVLGHTRESTRVTFALPTATIYAVVVITRIGDPTAVMSSVVPATLSIDTTDPRPTRSDGRMIATARPDGPAPAVLRMPLVDLARAVVTQVAPEQKDYFE